MGGTKFTNALREGVSYTELTVLTKAPAQEEETAREWLSGELEPDSYRTVCGCGKPFKSTSSFWNPSGKHHCQTCKLLFCTDCVTGNKGARKCKPLEGIRGECTPELRNDGTGCE